jgi:hypothetical protein
MFGYLVNIASNILLHSWFLSKLDSTQSLQECMGLDYFMLN